MDIPVTLATGAGLMTLAAFAGWRGARPPSPHRGPRLIPWRFIMLAAAACLLPILVHLAALLGPADGQS